ncbi:Glycosyl hydrolase [Deinococcus saxicola]
MLVALTLPLLLGACSTGSLPSTNAPPANHGAQALGAPSRNAPPATHSAQALEESFQSRAGRLESQVLTLGTNDLTLEPFTSTNGLGPVEVNRSNGDKGSADGGTLTVNGVTAARGFGTNAASSLTFALGGACPTFTAKVGVDDEVGNRGSVIFQVFADGMKVYDSGRMTGRDGARSVSVPVTGKRELRLVVTDAGDGLNGDHADWLNPVVTGCTASPTVSGPITITRSGTYSGTWESTTTTPAVTIQTSEPVVIENATIRGRGHLISGWRYDLTVHNVRGETLLPDVSGRSKGRAIQGEEIYNLRVENCTFDSGIYVRKFLGSGSQGIRVLRNTFSNIDGRQSNGAGGFNGNTSYTQMVQFNDVTKIGTAEIAWNQVVNLPGVSAVEDNINLYVSSGTPSSPILIHDNYIQGAYPANLSAGFSGGGIMLGDGKTADPLNNGYARAYNNVVVSTSNHGVAIAGGYGNEILNNRIISSGRYPDGSRIASQNVGMYVWDLYSAGTAFGAHRVEGNVIGWTRVETDGSEWTNNWWMPDVNQNGGTASGNTGLGAQTPDAEKAEFTLWQQKLASAGVNIDAR